MGDIVSKVKSYQKQGKKIVAVQGLGFVGTVLAAVVAEAKTPEGEPRYFVIGVNTPSVTGLQKIAQINSGQAPMVSPDQELPRLLHEAAMVNKNLVATSDNSVFAFADVIVVDIPFAVNNRDRFDPSGIEVGLPAFETAIRAVGRFMKPEALVLVETTVPIGSCEKIILPLLKEEREKRGLSGPIYLAHSYERVMPGPHYVDSIRKYWRTFAGMDKPSAVYAEEFLSSFIDTSAYGLRQLANPTASELAKLLENSYRAMNIAWIYEWTLLAEKLGINLFEVVDSVRVRKGTHDNMRYPGFGVGGYCLTKDSLLAQWSASVLLKTHITLPMTMEALRINYNMPLHTLDLVRELNHGDLAGKKVLVCGIAYLPDVGDTRNAPAEQFVGELKKEGAQVMVHDPCMQSWPERTEVLLEQDFSYGVASSEIVIFTVAHKFYKDLGVEAIRGDAMTPPAIVDAQNIITDEQASLLHKSGCRLLGVGKGHWRSLGYHL